MYTHLLYFHKTGQRKHWNSSSMQRYVRNYCHALVKKSYSKGKENYGVNKKNLFNILNDRVDIRYRNVLNENIEERRKTLERILWLR